MFSRYLRRGILLSLASLPWVCSADPAPTGLEMADLRCELSSQAVTERTTPRLSWQLRSAERAKMQTAYEILVASDPARLTSDDADLWKSGRVNSTQSINVLYVGKPLVARQRCYWKARAWDERGQPGPWSAAASWEMGLCQETDWAGAQWLRFDQAKVGRAQREDAARGAAASLSFPSPLLRKEFRVGEKVRRATAYVCGLGYHELYVNGQRVGDEVLEPAETTYDERAFYIVRDVTAQLRPGDDCLGLWLGNGFYGENLALGGSLAYGPPTVRAVLLIDYEDGRRETVGTDASWRAAVGPVRFDNVYWGETYDARRATRGWSEPGYPAKGWEPPQVVTPAPTRRVTIEDIPPARRLETWPPKAVLPGKDGRWIIDFGRNLAGWVRLRELPTADGQKIVLRFAEELSPDGTALDTHSTGPEATGGEQQDIYIGDGTPATWEPRFAYHGFRYAEVAGLAQRPDGREFEAVRVGTDLPSVGTFTSADEGLNRIYDTSLWTIRNNLCGQSEDCPTREKCSWLGDAHSMGEAALFSVEGERFWSKFCDDDETTLGKDRHREGRPPGPPGLPANISVGSRHCELAKADWGAAVVLLPWYLYLYEGNTDQATRQYSHMRDWVQYVETLKRDGIVEDGFGDWCPPNGNSHMDTPPDFTSTALQAASAHFLALLSPVAGLAGDAPGFEEIATRTREALVARFWQPGGGYLTQTENSVALRFGLYPDGKRSEVVDALLHAIDARQGHYNTGIHGSRWLYTGLADAGRADLALPMLLRPDYPSFAYALAEGFTTWPEIPMPMVPGKAVDSGSLSHPMQAGFAAFFHEALLGIRPDPAGPGFRHALLRPEGFESLRSADGGHRTPYGEITSRWQADGSKFIWNLTLPPNTTATVCLPSARGTAVTEHGGPAGTSAGVRRTGEEPGRAVFEVGSGSYEFQSTLP